MVDPDGILVEKLEAILGLKTALLPLEYDT